MGKEFKYDLAISLCKQDVEFARKLFQELNPTLKVFFYEERQDELISKSGPEVFAKIFSEDSRVVVVMSRKEWSDSYYTEIERNAIIDRTSVKNEGFSFLVILPMIKGEIPNWYPSTRIYLDPYRFSIERLAQILEYKITDVGGVVKPLSVKEQFERVKLKINQRKELIRLQQNKDSIKEAIDEIKNVRKIFNSKIDVFEDTGIFKTSFHQFNEFNNSATFSIQEHELECSVPDLNKVSISNAQDIYVELVIYQIFDIGFDYERKPIKKEVRKFLYRPPQKLWCIDFLPERATENEMEVLFRQKNKYFDLVNPISTEELLEYWFQELLVVSTSSVTRHLN